MIKSINHTCEKCFTGKLQHFPVENGVFDKDGDLVKNFFFHFEFSLQLVSLLFSVQKRFGH